MEKEKAGVRFVQIETTTRCNFTCKFCCGRHFEQQDISFDTYQEVFEKFGGIEHVCLHGEGEPLLHPEIFKMADYAKEKGSKVSIITNGSLISKHDDNLLDSGFTSIWISMDTTDEKAFRDFRGGDLKKIIQSIRRLQQKKLAKGLIYPAIGFTVSVLSYNINELNKIEKLYDDLRLDGEIYIQFLNGSDHYTQYYDKSLEKEFLTPAQYEQVVENYIGILKRVYNKKIQDRHFYDELAPFYKPNLIKGINMARLSCEWLNDAVYVNVKGEATACCLVKDHEKHSYGNVLRCKGMDILEKRAQSLQMLSSGKVPEECKHCITAKKVSLRSVNAWHLEMLQKKADKDIFETLLQAKDSGRQIIALFSLSPFDLETSQGGAEVMTLEIAKGLSKDYAVVVIDPVTEKDITGRLFVKLKENLYRLGGFFQEDRLWQIGILDPDFSPMAQEILKSSVVLFTFDRVLYRKWAVKNILVLGAMGYPFCKEALKSLLWDCISVPSVFMRNWVIRELGHIRDVFMIPNGIDLKNFLPDFSDTPFYCQNDQDRGSFHFLIPGRPGNEKGFYESVDFVEKLSTLGMDITLHYFDFSTWNPAVGWFYDAFNAYAKKKGVRLIKHPWASRNTMREYYKMVSLTLMLGKIPEGFGLSALESVASNTPVLIVDQGALPELLPPDHGILRMKDFNDLDKAEVILKLKTAQRNCGNGIVAIYREYSLDKMVSSYHGIIKKGG